jgi:hypothetical protein
VYDGNVKLGEALASSGGLWTLEATLPDIGKGNQSLHTVHALVKTNMSTLYSESATVLYDPAAPQLIKMCMYQTNRQRVCMDPSLGIARLHFRIAPKPLIFELLFNKPDNVTDVVVGVAGPGGGIGNASLGSDGVYRAVITPNLLKNLEDISVSYSNKPALKLIDGKLPPPPPKEELLRTMPPDLANMNVTVLDSNATGQSATVTLTDGRRFDISTNINKDVNYLPDAEDVEKVKSSGLPFYGVELSQKQIGGALQIQTSYFVPYSALPTEVLEAIESDAPAEVSQPSIIPTSERIVPVSQGLSGIRVTSAIVDYSSEGGDSSQTPDEEWVARATIVGNVFGAYSVLAGGALSWIGFYAPALALTPVGGVVVGVLIGSAVGAGLCWALCSYVPAIITWLKDPSGYVYEAVPSNLLENVTATVAEKDEASGTWSKWNAQDFGQTNPQTTAPDGSYGWDVPEGDWQVLYEKPAYERAYSEVIHVSPPRTDVNEGMISLEPPKVTAVSAVVNNSTSNGTEEEDAVKLNSTIGTLMNSTSSSSINVQFNKYIPISNLTNTTITVFNDPSAMGNNDDSAILKNSSNTSEQEKLSGNIVHVNATADSNGTLFTRQASFIPAQPLTVDNRYDVHVSREIQSYAGVPMMEDHNTTVTAIDTLNYSLSLKPNNNSTTENTSISSTEKSSPPIQLALGQSLMTLWQLILHLFGLDLMVSRWE